MSTVVATPRAIDIPGADGQGDFDETKAAAWIAQEMERRFPDSAPFYAVPGGEANGEWGRLVRGNGVALPMPEQDDAANELAERAVCDSDDFWTGRGC